jgi:hypothetical protein
VNAAVIRITADRWWRIREDGSGVVNAGIKLPIRAGGWAAGRGAVIIPNPRKANGVSERNANRARDEIRAALSDVYIRCRGTSKQRKEEQKAQEPIQ